MSKTRYPAIIFLILIVASLALPLFYYSRLPDTIATHFNFRNEADGWMSKNSFFIVEMAVAVLLSGMFFSIAYFVPKFPNSMINLPNKNYWLSAERREESMNVFQQFIYWLGSLTLGFLTLISQEVFILNLQGRNKISSSIWIYLFVFLAVLAFIIIKMVMHFNRTENKNEIKK